MGHFLANDRLRMMTSHVVPLDPILVEIVENGDASLIRFGVPRVQPLFPVIGLRLLEESGVGPVANLALGLGSDSDAGGRPIPPVDDRRLQVLPFAPSEVALPPAGPNVVQVFTPDDVIADVLVFVPGAERDRVHAKFPAVVPGRLPVHLEVGAEGAPRKVVPLPVGLVVNPATFAGGPVGVAELSRSEAEINGQHDQKSHLFLLMNINRLPVPFIHLLFWNDN